jgi:hypothetical protein
MRPNRKHGLALVTVALGAMALALVSPAGATHLRPKGASPLRDSLVVAQKPCVGAPTVAHNSPPVPAPTSCTAASTPPNPVQASTYLTAGEPTVNGAPAQFIGFVLLKVIGSPNNDVQIQSNLTDIRCQTGASPCGPANSLDGPDYTGQLQLLFGQQVTDHGNGPSSFTTAGTVVAVPFPVTIPCVSTTSATIGSTCSVNTTMNAQVPGWVVSGRRAEFEIPQGTPGGGIQVFDGGSTGVAGSSGATLFAESGVFLP